MARKKSHAKAAKTGSHRRSQKITERRSRNQIVLVLVVVLVLDLAFNRVRVSRIENCISELLHAGTKLLRGRGRRRRTRTKKSSPNSSIYQGSSTKTEILNRKVAKVSKGQSFPCVAFTYRNALSVVRIFKPLLPLLPSCSKFLSLCPSVKSLYLCAPGRPS